MYRNVFYSFIFLKRKISLTSKMVYSKNTRVHGGVQGPSLNRKDTPRVSEYIRNFYGINVIEYDESIDEVHFVRKREETAEWAEKQLIGPFPPTLSMHF